MTVGFLELRRLSAGRGAVEREEQRCLGGIIVRVIVIVVAGRPVRRGRAVLHRGRHRSDCAGAIAGTADVSADVVVAVAAADYGGGADHVPLSCVDRRPTRRCGG